MEQCSIDALLEKTIKHMLFLQSVTKHADKLKVAGEPKVCGFILQSLFAICLSLLKLLKNHWLHLFSNLKTK